MNYKTAWTVCCFLVLSLSSLTVAREENDCPVTYLVSAPDVLSQVKVGRPSYNYKSDNQDFVSFDVAWCSLPPAQGNYINLTFTEPTVITSFRVNGYKSAYVSTFSLRFQKNSTNTLQLYKQFSLYSDDSVTFNVANVTVLKLQFLIHSAVLGVGKKDIYQYCWHANVFGCRSNEAISRREKEIIECPSSLTSSFSLVPIFSSSPSSSLLAPSLSSQSLSPATSSPSLPSLSSSPPPSQSPLSLPLSPSPSPSPSLSPSPSSLSSPLTLSMVSSCMCSWTKYEAMMNAVAPSLAVLILLLTAASIVIAIMSVALYRYWRKPRQSSSGSVQGVDTEGVDNEHTYRHSTNSKTLIISSQIMDVSHGHYDLCHASEKEEQDKDSDILYASISTGQVNVGNEIVTKRNPAYSSPHSAESKFKSRAI